MRLISPTNWPWLLMLGVPIVLYLFRRRPRTVRVSTLAFFKLLAKAHQESPWLRRLKFLLSLLLCLLMVGLPALGLLRPVADSSREQLRTLVVLVDRSASMAAVDGNKRSRLSLGLDRVRERLGQIGDGTAICLIAYDRRAEVLLPASHDRRQLERALNALAVRPIGCQPGDRAAALQLAHRLAELDPLAQPAKIWHVTQAAAKDESASTRPDEPASVAASRPTGEPAIAGGGVAGAARAASPVPVERFDVALDRPRNVGITLLQVRRVPMQAGQLEAFVQVESSSPEPAEVKVTAFLDEEPLAPRTVSVSADAPAAISIPLKAKPDARSLLCLKLEADQDCLGLDNQAFAVIPPTRVIHVQWVTPQQSVYTQLVLSALVGPDMKVSRRPPQVWPNAEPCDVAVFDGCVPEKWPEGLPVILLNPPAKVGPIQLERLQAGLPVDRLRLPQPDHPLLLGVASQRVSVLQTAVVKAIDGMDPLWVGPAGPILQAGECRDQRVVVMAVDVTRSERLAFSPGYPLLLGNAIYWTTEPAVESSSGHNHRTGELAAMTGEQVTWRRPDLPGDDRQMAVPVAARQFELDRLGFWETGKAGQGEVGSASLLSARETKLRSADREPGEATAPADGKWKIVPPDLLCVLLWLVLAVLVVESWLYHRHSVY